MEAIIKSLTTGEAQSESFSARDPLDFQIQHAEKSKIKDLDPAKASVAKSNVAQHANGIVLVRWVPHVITMWNNFATEARELFMRGVKECAGNRAQEFRQHLWKMDYHHYSSLCYIISRALQGYLVTLKHDDRPRFDVLYNNPEALTVAEITESDVLTAIFTLGALKSVFGQKEKGRKSSHYMKVQYYKTMKSLPEGIPKIFDGLNMEDVWGPNGTGMDGFDVNGVSTKA